MALRIRVIIPEADIGSYRILCANVIKSGLPVTLHHLKFFGPQTPIFDTYPSIRSIRIYAVDAAFLEESAGSGIGTIGIINQIPGFYDLADVYARDGPIF